MSQENVDVVQGLFDRWGSDYWREAIAEDVVWDVSAVPFAGMSGIYRGHAGVEQFFRNWLGPWENPIVELVEIAPAGDSVFVEMRWRARGRSSGAEVAQAFFGIYDLRGGRIVRFRQRETREDALEGAGLAE
jgi:ketosteroid isomerase-like protein